MLKVSFCAGLKPSKREEFSQIPQRILEKHALVQAKFGDIVIPVDVCVDESITKRTEFKLDGAKCNRALAYLGDAHLSLYLAQSAYAKGFSAHEFQAWRTLRTSDQYLASVYDKMFGENVIVFECFGGPTTRQKATFVEALIGALGTTETGLGLMETIIGE